MIYYKSMPMTISAANKRKWTIIDIPRREDLSYVGILNRVSKHTKGRWIHKYDFSGGGTFAFESFDDATLVNLQLNFF